LSQVQNFCPLYVLGVDSCWVLMKFLPTAVAAGDIPVLLLSEMGLGKVAIRQCCYCGGREKAESNDTST